MKFSIAFIFLLFASSCSIKNCNNYTKCEYICFSDSIITIEDNFIIEKSTSSRITGYRFDGSVSVPVLLVKPKCDLDRYNYFDFKINSTNIFYADKGIYCLTDKELKEGMFYNFENIICKNAKPLYLSNNKKYQLLEKRMKLVCRKLSSNYKNIINPANNKVYVIKKTDYMVIDVIE